MEGFFSQSLGLVGSQYVDIQMVIGQLQPWLSCETLGSVPRTNQALLAVISSFAYQNLGNNALPVSQLFSVVDIHLLIGIRTVVI